MFQIQNQHDEVLNRIMDEYEWLMQRTQPNLSNLLEWTTTIPTTTGMLPAFPELEVDECIPLILYYAHKYRILFSHNNRYLHPYVNQVW